MAAENGPHYAAVEGPNFNGKTSFFGLVAPPIQGELTYDQLLQAAREGHVASMQIAVQHDVVIATMSNGWRYSCLLADERFPELLADAMNADGSTPFEVLPIDESRAAVREGARHFLNLAGVLWLADLAGLLPWDTTPYNSLAERDKAQASGEAPARGQMLASLREKVHGLLSTLRGDRKQQTGTGRPTGGCKAGEPSGRGKTTDGVAHDEALRRVLGLTTWDAAAELKANRQRLLDRIETSLETSRAEFGKSKASFQADLETSKVKLRAELQTSTRHLRPRRLERRLLEARPHELERHLIDAAGDLKASVEELETRLREAPWVTPRTLDDSTTLPTLDELLTRACRVSSDGLVAQYIRAHPSSALTNPIEMFVAAEETGLPSAERASVAPPPFPKPRLLGDGPWPTADVASEEEEQQHEWYGEESVCRLCPSFSALYNHDVYICKRLAVVPA